MAVWYWMDNNPDQFLSRLHRVLLNSLSFICFFYTPSSQNTDFCTLCMCRMWFIKRAIKLMCIIFFDNFSLMWTWTRVYKIGNIQGNELQFSAKHELARDPSRGETRNIFGYCMNTQFVKGGPISIKLKPLEFMQLRTFTKVTIHYATRS